MQFLKRHYEKIILSLVLLGLAGAAVWLMIRVTQIKEELNESMGSVEGLPQGPLVLQPFAVYSNTLARATNPPTLDMSKQHLVFNPFVWQVKPNGDIIKIQTGKEIGPDAVVVSKVTPLSLILSIDRTTGTAESPQVQLGYERQSSTNIVERRKTQRFLSFTTKVTFPLEGTNVTVTLKEIRGNYPDEPELVLELLIGDTPQTITLTKTKPFSQITAYSADLQYPPEGIKFPEGRRVGDSVVLGGVTYNIIAITDSRVVLSAPNEKRFPIPYRPAP
jgi:hypothetical protein